MPERLIGRTAELEVGHRFLADLGNGPRSLRLEGEPGIGKSAILSALVEAALTRSYTTLTARPAPSEVTYSFAALGDLLSGVPKAAFSSLPPPQRRALDEALFLRDVGGAPRPAGVLGAAVLNLLRGLAEERPVLLAIDDEQWLDRPTVRVLSYALRRLRAESVGVLLATRASDSGRRAPSILETVDLPLRSIEIGPLSLGSLHHVLSERIGAPIPRQRLVQIERASGGNPFFAIEFARSMLRPGDRFQPGTPLEVPADLRGVASARLSELSAETRHVLLAVAAEPHPQVSLIERVVPGAAEHLRVGVEEGVIAVEGARVMFTHPLLASIVYHDATAKERNRMHRALADAITHAEERARHLAVASETPDETIAAEIGRGAVAARARGAPEAAADLWEAAARLGTKGPPAFERRLSGAVARFESGDVAATGDALESLIAEAPPGPLRGRARVDLATTRIFGDSLTEAIPLLREALDELDEDDEARAEAELALGWATVWTGDVMEGLAHARRALALLRTSGDDAAIAPALAAVAATEFLIGERTDLQALDVASGAERPDDRIPAGWRASILRAYVLKLADQWEESRAAFGSLLRAHRDMGDDATLPYLLFQTSESETWTGNADAGRRLAEEGLELATLNGQRLMRGANLYARALADAHLGREDEARDAAEEALALAVEGSLVPLIQFAASVLGFIGICLDDPETTHRHLAPLATAVTAAGIGDPAVFRFLPDEIEALVGLGRLDEARQMLDPFEDRGRALGRRWVVAASGRCRALLRAAEGDAEGALEAVEEALVRFDVLPLPFERTRTLLAKGMILRRSRQKHAASETLGAAAEAFERLRAPRWVAKARRELDRVGLRPTAPTGLTATERQVALLAASGRTNRQIAEAAFMSPKTVESVLGRVYRKLGIRSRAELGAAMAETPGMKDVTPPPH